MDRIALFKEICAKTETKVVLLVMDGIGGLPAAPGGKTELETAATPHLDALAAESLCGMADPVAYGVTPGSGPGHLGLFGFDPLEVQIGRGVLATLGIGFDLQPADVPARINFCTLDADGNVTDRRAGRIATELCTELAAKLDTIRVEGAETFVRPIKEHRAAVVFRGAGLSGAVADTDPQKTGVPPLAPEAKCPEAGATAALAAAFIAEAQKALAGQPKANGVLLRGFDCYEPLATLEEIFGLHGAAVAAYPMYKGIARLVGMDVLETGETPAEQFATVREHWDAYDFFFVHIKKTDSYGEDGNFDAKVHVIETVDEALPALRALGPDALIVTGDHSTPAVMKSHSWHPVPTLVYSACCRPDTVAAYGERACATGGLGRLPLKDVLPIALANAGKLQKFGA
jgi:2,3-bisphosphoglycerate-independent phosphoglycerate mutase